MQMLRSLLTRHRHLAMVLMVLALCLKAALPAGFMLSADAAHVLTVTVCSETTGAVKQMQITVPQRHDAPGKTVPAQKDGTCAFAGHGMAALGGADVLLLAAALAFILLLGLAPERVTPPARPAYLRPPLRGPPLNA
ncbi:MAG: hypothetical protein RLZZ08_907 [Pseudomonadota bacterium]|jgi:hypothetical protein